MNKAGQTEKIQAVSLIHQGLKRLLIADIVTYGRNLTINNYSLSLYLYTRARTRTHTEVGVRLKLFRLKGGSSL